MSDAFSIQTRRTTCPRMSMPRIAAACASASSGVFASLMPPAFPRPPTSTCALTTTGPPSPRRRREPQALSPRAPPTQGCRRARTAPFPGVRRDPRPGASLSKREPKTGNHSFGRSGVLANGRCCPGNPRETRSDARQGRSDLGHHRRHAGRRGGARQHALRFPAGTPPTSPPASRRKQARASAGGAHRGRAALRPRGRRALC